MFPPGGVILEYLTGKRRIVNIPEGARLLSFWPDNFDARSLCLRIERRDAAGHRARTAPDPSGSREVSAGRGTGFAEENRLREKRFCLWLSSSGW